MTIHQEAKPRKKWYYVRIRNDAGKIVREVFKTRSHKRATLYRNMYPEAHIEEIWE